MNAKHNKIVLKKKPPVTTIFLAAKHPDTKMQRILKASQCCFISGRFLLIFGEEMPRITRIHGLRLP